MAIRFPVGRQQIRGAVKYSKGTAATIDVRAAMADIQKNFEQVIDSLEGVTEDAIAYALQPILDTSQELVPVDTGALKASGFLQTQKIRGKVSGVVGYARGGNPFYAAIVHENLEFYHTPPTQAKFLEEAVNRGLRTFKDDLIDYMMDSVDA